MFIPEENSVLSTSQRKSAGSTSKSGIVTRRRSFSQGGSIGGESLTGASQAFETELQAVESNPWWYAGESEEYYLDKDEVYRILDGEHLTWNRRFQDIFDGTPHRRDAHLHFIINFISILAIVMSCVTFCILTLPENVNNRTGEGADYSNAWFVIDASCILVFIVEISIRIWARKDWVSLMDIFFAIDIVTVLGFVADVLIDQFSAGSQGGVALVRLLRLFRVFRVFKLSRHSKSLQLVVMVLKKSAAGLTVLTLPLLIAVLVFSSVIYLFEVLAVTWNTTSHLWLEDSGLPSKFQSVPDAIWFTMSTVTTVGFGDIVPKTIAGKVVAVIASFFGILILSFPNIVLGGNLQYAFRTFYQARARRALGRKFRRVFHMVVFCRELQRLADQRTALREYDAPQEVDASELAAESTTVNDCGGVAETALRLEQRDPEVRFAGSDSGALRLGRVPSQSALLSTGNALTGANSKKVNVNFVATKQELDFFRRDDIPPITDDNIRQWKWNNLSGVRLLQRLLELCSGVGTVQELHQCFAKRGEHTRSTDIAIVALYLMEADFLEVFVFRRGATNMLLSLTQKASQELMLHAEEGMVDCIRSIDVARIVWKRTAQSQPHYSLHLLISVYKIWAATEKMVDNKEHTPNTDVKITFWKMSDRLGGGNTSLSLDRRASSLALPATRPSNVDIRDAKQVLQNVLAKQLLRIKELEAEIMQADQQTANSFGM